MKEKSIYCKAVKANVIKSARCPVWNCDTCPEVRNPKPLSKSNKNIPKAYTPPKEKIKIEKEYAGWDDPKTWKQYEKDLKEYCKQHPIKKHVRRRDKKSPISVDVNIFLKKNDYIRLTVTAMPNDWRKLIPFLEDYPEGLTDQFKNTVLHKVLPLLNEKNKPRGVYYRISDLTGRIRWCAGLYYIVFQYLFKLPEKERPKGFTDLKKKDIIYSNALDMTIHFMRTLFGEEAKQRGLFAFDEDSESFYKIYIRGSKYWKSYRDKEHIKDKTLQDKDIRELINRHTNPLTEHLTSPLMEIFNP